MLPRDCTDKEDTVSKLTVSKLTVNSHSLSRHGANNLGASKHGANRHGANKDQEDHTSLTWVLSSWEHNRDNLPRISWCNLSSSLVSSSFLKVSVLD